MLYGTEKKENHNYIVGCFSDKDKAIEMAEEHTTYRGGKYACVVEECELDSFSNDNKIKEVYKTKSAWCRFETFQKI